MIKKKNEKNDLCPLTFLSIVLYCNNERRKQMNIYKVKLSDGHAEWWETLEAKNEDHLFDIVDASGYDVANWHFASSIPAIVNLED